MSLPSHLPTHVSFMRLGYVIYSLRSLNPCAGAVWLLGHATFHHPWIASSWGVRGGAGELRHEGYVEGLSEGDQSLLILPTLVPLCWRAHSLSKPQTSFKIS